MIIAASISTAWLIVVVIYFAISSIIKKMPLSCLDKLRRGFFNQPGYQPGLTACKKSVDKNYIAKACSSNIFFELKTWLTIWSPTLKAFAAIVSDGLKAPQLGKKLASTT